MARHFNIFRSLFHVLAFSRRILAVDFGQSYGSSSPDLLVPRLYTKGDFDDSSDHVNFHPEGATEGFRCHYPEFKSKDWEGCNDGANNRWCWIRQKGAHKNDSDRKGYTITTDCKSCYLMLDHSSHEIRAYTHTTTFGSRLKQMTTTHLLESKDMQVKPYLRIKHRLVSDTRLSTTLTLTSIPSLQTGPPKRPVSSTEHTPDP